MMDELTPNAELKIAVDEAIRRKNIATSISGQDVTAAQFHRKQENERNRKIRDKNNASYQYRRAQSLTAA